MRLEYELTPQEVLEIQRRDLLAVWRNWPERLLLTGPLLILAAIAYLAVSSAAGWLCVSLVPALIVLALWRFYIPVPSRRQVEAYLQATGGGPTVLQADEAHLEVSEPRRRFRMDWNVLLAFHETSKVFVLSSKFGGGFAVPKRAFRAAAEVEDFRRLLLRKLQPSGERPR
jgi:hypothetical protein